MTSKLLFTYSEAALNSAKNKFRIYVNIGMGVATLVAAIAMVIIGKSRAKKGESVSNINIRRHPETYSKLIESQNAPKWRVQCVAETAFHSNISAALRTLFETKINNLDWSRWKGHYCSLIKYFCCFKTLFKTKINNLDWSRRKGHICSLIKALSVSVVYNVDSALHCFDNRGE